MVMPQLFTLDVSSQGQPLRVREMAGASEADVVSLDDTIGSQMDATNAMVLACAAVPTAQVTSWNGIYAAWQSLHNDWAAWKAQEDSIPSIDLPSQLEAAVVNGQYITKMNAGQNGQSFLNWAKTYQTIVTAACSNIVPPPQPPPAPVNPPGPPTPAGPQGSWLCTTFGINCSPSTPSTDDGTDWPTALKWGAILGLALVAAWYVGPLIATLAGVGAGAVRKRASGSDEFQPVAMFKRNASGFSFGNMDVEAPMIEPLQFGDVPRDEVLALIGDGQE
jgi:hypothetical protein